MPPPAPRTAVPTRLTPRARRGQARGASNPTARPRLRWRARASLADEGGCPRTASGTRRALGGGVFPPATSSPFHLEVFPSAHPAPPNEPHHCMLTHAELCVHAPTHSSCPGQYRAPRYAERGTLRVAARRVTPLSTELSEKRPRPPPLPSHCPTPRCQVFCTRAMAVACVQASRQATPRGDKAVRGAGPLPANAGMGPSYRRLREYRNSERRGG